MTLIDMLKSEGDVVKAEVVEKTDVSGTSITFYTRGRENEEGIRAISNIIKNHFAKKGLGDLDYRVSEENYRQQGIFDEVSIEAKSTKGERAVRSLAKYLSRNKVFGFKSEEYIFKKSKFKRQAKY